MSDGGLTDQFVHRWLQEIADGSWVSLHYDSPVLADGTYAELFGGGYTRKQVDWAQPTNRAIWSLSVVRFTGLAQGQATHFGVWDKRVNGTLLAYAALPERAVFRSGHGYAIPAGELAISIG